MPTQAPNFSYRLRKWGVALAGAAGLTAFESSATTDSDPPPTPPCQISLDNPDIAFGRINPYDLPNTVAYTSQRPPSVGRQLRTLQVQCMLPTRFALRFRAPAHSSGQGYPLGDAGVVLVSIARAQADGIPALLTSNPSPVTIPVQPIDAMEWKPNHVLQVVTQGQVGPVTQLTLQVEIEARVLIRTDRLRQDQPFDSEGSFEVQPLSL